MLEGLARGDERDLEALVARHWAPLVRYAASILGDPDDARDAAQEAVTRLWVRRDSFGTIVSARALLVRLVRNVAFDELRRRRRRARIIAVAPIVEEPPREPDELLAEAELRSVVQQAVEGLPERRREVFRLAREGGLSYVEIAELLNLSPQTVANHMSLALHDLRRAIADW